MLIAPVPAAATSAPIEYRLVQYPGAGYGGLYAQIAQARRSIDMEMYELDDTTAERDLVAAEHRGVQVRVLLDRAYHGAEANQTALRELRAGGVPTRLAPANVIFHIKATTFDDRTTDISTANLDARYYATDRDAEIVDTDPDQVHAVQQTFDHDWAAGGAGGDLASQTVQAPGLIWSPNTGTQSAQSSFVAAIAGARSSIDFESEELSDPAVQSALAADARRGVACRIVMNASPELDSAFATLTHAGCRVHTYPETSRGLYIHEKLILEDAGSARESLLLGSQNASVTSLERNRELSVRVGRADGGAAAIASAAATFESDFSHAVPWSDR